jgi:hypothetical protein
LSEVLTMLKSSDYRTLARVHPEDFTRNRKLLFEDVMMMNIRGYYHGLANEQRLVEPLLSPRMSVKSLCASPQALSKARKKITPEAYQILSRHLVKGFYADDDLLLWRGKWRVLGLDGSTVQLPPSKEIIAGFGVVAPSTFPLGRLSVLYDVRNRFVLDVILDTYHQDERAMAMQHCEFLHSDKQEHSWSDLVLADRNYPCFYLMLSLLEMQKDFLFRYAAKGASCIKEVASALAEGHTDTVITIDLTKPGRAVNERLAPLLQERKERGESSHTLTLRMVAITGENNQPMVILTSLLDPGIIPDELLALYHERWQMETQYDVVKNVLHLEDFSSTSFQGVMQDLYAAMLLANFLALALYDVREELEEYNAAKERKHSYAINITQAVSSLRLRLIAVVICEDTREIQNIMDTLRKALLKHKVPIRNNRTSTTSQRKRKHPHLKHPNNTKSII